MIIRKLKVTNLRNLAGVEITAHQGLNYVFGDNGAGKTSLLESIAVLSRGRSFRTTQPTELNGPVDKSFQVFAKAIDDNGGENRLGLERCGKHWKGRLNGRDVEHLSQLTRNLPIVLMEPDSHLLVSGPPETRRRYLDWGMFHVEHGFLDVWRKFSKALKQRNAALRNSNTAVLDSIDVVLAEYGSRLGELRKKHSASLSGGIDGMMKELSSSVQHVGISYMDGWKTESYLESLQSKREKDIDRGVTGTGPHRADLTLTCDDTPARSVLSRGEQKLFAAAMLLTQAEWLGENGEKPVLLLDDLVSEFDRKHFEKVLERALRTGSQVWVTGTSKPDFDFDHHMFHVEQGRVIELL